MRSDGSSPGMAQQPVRPAHVIELVMARAFLFLVGLLPFRVASAIGGWLGRNLGPKFGVTKVARRNLEKAFPEKSPVEIDAIIRGMWDNLGRTAFEFPNLGKLRYGGPDAQVEVIGAEHATALKDDITSGLFVSGHLANWELTSLAIMNCGVPAHLVYRAPNNPLMEPIFAKRDHGQGEFLPKGAKGARRAIQLLKAGKNLGMLVDQKMNDGLPVPFFGRDAMTAPATAQFAYRYDCVVVPVRIERIGGARFRVTFHPPMALPDTGDRQADTRQLMVGINDLLESWIRERPSQWLWVHRRWPD